MKNSLFCSFFAFLLLLPFHLRGQVSPHVSGQLIVHLHPETGLYPWMQQGLRGVEGYLPFENHRWLSRRLNMVLLTYDTTQISDEDALRQIIRRPGVISAQFDHYVESRSLTETLPNDALFASQWALKNVGQNGGTPDADIDATEAWDITTGGLSSLGDTIVIAGDLQPVFPKVDIVMGQISPFVNH
ncbi:MAG: hypothetical protein AAFP92_08205, partial [Bacteroidota bacterium]